MRKTLKKNPSLAEYIYVKSSKKKYKPMQKEPKLILNEFLRKFKVKEDRLYYENKSVILFVPK